jgi:hypothetical protein
MKKSKKLTLNRETLRTLNPEHLMHAHGMTGPARCYSIGCTPPTGTGPTSNNCATGSATCNEN